jgi:multidrug efflux pump subunit AcrA (membrane-fusion protein)
LHEESDRVFVQGLLRDGDQVVVDGTQRIVPGMVVRLGVRRTAANNDQG